VGITGRVYQWSMTKRQKLTLQQMTLEKIPCVRRHVYFYVLLFLTTAVLHNAWKSSSPDAAAEAIKAGEAVAEVQRELTIAEARLAP